MGNGSKNADNVGHHPADIGIPGCNLLLYLESILLTAKRSVPGDFTRRGQTFIMLLYPAGNFIRLIRVEK
jgi:hypothetical protein